VYTHYGKCSTRDWPLNPGNPVPHTIQLELRLGVNTRVLASSTQLQRVGAGFGSSGLLSRFSNLEVVSCWFKNDSRFLLLR
jgi:hypothetical protein